METQDLNSIAGVDDLGEIPKKLWNRLEDKLARGLYDTFAYFELTESPVKYRKHALRATAFLSADLNNPSSGPYLIDHAACLDKEVSAQERANISAIWSSTPLPFFTRARISEREYLAVAPILSAITSESIDKVEEILKQEDEILEAYWKLGVHTEPSAQMENIRKACANRLPKHERKITKVKEISDINEILPKLKLRNNGREFILDEAGSGVLHSDSPNACLETISYTRNGKKTPYSIMWLKRDIKAHELVTRRYDEAQQEACL